MTGPRPTQESLWSGNSFPEVAPQCGNPCSSVCEETEGPSRGALLTRHPQRADGKGRQGVPLCKLPRSGTGSEFRSGPIPVRGTNTAHSPAPPGLLPSVTGFHRPAASDREVWARPLRLPALCSVSQERRPWYQHGPRGRRARRPGGLSCQCPRYVRFSTHTGTDRSAPSLLKGEGLKNRRAISAGPEDEPHLSARGGSPTRLHILLTQPHVTPPLLGLLGPRRPGGQCHRPGAGGQQPRGGHVPSAPAGWCPQDAEQCPASQG